VLAQSLGHALYSLGESMGTMAAQMKKTMEGCDQMRQDRTFIRDREMQKDMDRIGKHMGNMADNMEETLQTIERMTKRLRQHQTGK